MAQKMIDPNIDKNKEKEEEEKKYFILKVT